MIAKNIQSLQARIETAAKRACRNSEDISLLAVSKTVAASRVLEAIQAGQHLFGENYVQEAKAKIAELRNLGFNERAAEFHFIGHLQRNKVKDAVQLFSVIHTVDRKEVAETISAVAGTKGVQQKILVQVNVSGEESKSGVALEGAKDLCEYILGLPNLSLQGLMTIGSYVEETASQNERRKEFQQMEMLRRELTMSLGVELSELSMGMSHDFELAIEEGATLVRIGSGVFGERISSNVERSVG